MRSDQVVQGLYSWVLKPSKDGNCVSSVGNLFHCLTILIYLKKNNKIIQSERVWFQFMSVVSHAFTVKSLAPHKEWHTVFPRSL